MKNNTENTYNTKKLFTKLNNECKINPREYSPLVLAYIGDAVFEMFIRTKIVSKGNAPVNKLHKQAKEYVKASSQAAMYNNIKSYLTEEEIAVFKRGRNAKSSTIPKNADLLDYKYATGLEALCGYLYLDGKIDRLQYLINLGIEIKKSQG
ncbi:Mini-ribonuclease 3 [Defluviitalea phaphyphila]|uniref:Mini-ribonuclease 3 n=1 Tax=Defluviitalea phaphyphila TaxID=1473580 RepID=UPI0007306FF1|nr:ribonuclease III domain-containing protein [Defluviitalea phaphyphila]